MIIQFNTGDVTFFEDDQAYFEKRLNDVTKRQARKFHSKHL